MPEVIQMKIMSFNTQHCLNYLEKKIDYPVMADAILSCGADVVGLNEMRSKGEAADYDYQTEALSALTGMAHYYFAKAIDVRGSNPYGNAYNVKLLAIPNSQVCKLMDSAAEGVSWNTPYPNYTHTVEAGNAIRWAENCVSVDVKYHAEGTAENYTNVEDGTYRIYFLDQGTGFGIYGLACK